VLTDRLLAHVSRDFRYGLRSLAKSPAFATAAVLTLALGIGANTAIFSFVDTILLRPLPFDRPERLVTAGEVSNGGKGTGGFSQGTLLDWRAGARAFEGPAGWANRAYNLSDNSAAPERVDGMAVTWDFFRTLGVQPALGREFTAADDRPGAPRVAVLGDELWRRRFAGDPGIVGRSVMVDGAPATVIGIMPARFRFFYGPEMWMPLAIDAAAPDRRTYFLGGVARLKPGVTLEQARAQAQAISQAIARPGAKWSARLAPLKDAFVAQKERDRLLVLLGAVGFVLLIACANVANLLLARSPARQRELAVRAALGATRGRLVAQSLTESLLLALAGGALGLAFAFEPVKLLPALVSEALLAGRAEVGLDLRVLAFTLALSLAAALVFGMFPAWRASRVALRDALSEGGVRGASARGRLRGALVVAEVALSFVLLACAGLMIRSLSALQDVDFGFRRDHLVTMQLAMSKQRFATPESVRTFYTRVLEAARAVPGVRAAGLSMGQAPWDTPEALAFDIVGEPPPGPGRIRGAALERVGGDYFSAMGIELRHGRLLTERDGESSPLVAMVNEKAASLYFPGRAALGRRIAVLGKEWEVTGIVADVKFGGPEADSVPMLYLPMAQSPWAGGALALATGGDSMAAAAAVRAALARIDRETPVARVRTMERIAAESMAQPRTQTGLMAAFAALALALAALGIYGVVSYTVAQSTHDFGVRMALGATGAGIVRHVLARGALLAALGLACGLAGALALTRLLRTLLFHVKPVDPLTFVTAAAALAAVSLVAAYIPARRAARLDPVAALRAE
jgi:putative ABC transport system permease protein